MLYRNRKQCGCSHSVTNHRSGYYYKEMISISEPWGFLESIRHPKQDNGLPDSIHIVHSYLHS